MKTLESPDNRLETPPPPSGDVDISRLPSPRKAAMLSAVPGLGQFYNGEKGKGWLFLGVGLFNLIAIVTMAFPVQVIGAIGHAGSSVGLNSNPDLSVELMKALSTRALFLVYLAFSAYFMIFAIQDAYETADRRRKGSLYDSFPLELSEAASGSYLFHLAVMASCLIAILFMVAPKPPTEVATEIEFVQPEPEPEPEPPPPPPPPKAAPKRQPKPVPLPKPAVITPPVENPETPPIPVPVEDPPPFVDPGPPANGFDGGTETGSDYGVPGGVEQEVDFSSYLADMQKRIKKHWHPPKGNESKTVTLKFKVKKDGTVRRIRLVKSSGLSIVDNAAKVAVKQAAPFARLPKGAADEVDIKFTFDYNVFNGGQAAKFWN